MIDSGKTNNQTNKRDQSAYRTVLNSVFTRPGLMHVTRTFSNVVRMRYAHVRTRELGSLWILLHDVQ